MDITTYALSKGYTDNSIRGITGVLAGKNCTIESIEPIEGGNRITYKWTADDETVRTSTLDVMDGEQGDKGDKGDKGNKGDKGDPGTDGEDGVGIVSIEKTSTVGNVDTYTITLSDGSTYDYTVTNGSGGGTTVIANPTLAGTEDGLEGLQVGETKYKVPSGTEVVANPTLVGTESDLTALQVGDTKYKIPSGGTVVSTGGSTNGGLHLGDIYLFEKKIGTVVPSGNFVAQGFAVDRNYYYIFDSNGGKCCRVSRADTTSTTLYTLGTSSIGHCNSATYNPKDKCIYIAKAQNSTDLAGVAVLDTTTMTIVRTIDNSEIVDGEGNQVSIVSIAYDPITGHFYAVGGPKCNELDENFTWIRSFNPESTDIPTTRTGQGLGCDGKYIYVLQSNIQGKGFSIVRVFDLNGKYVRTQILHSFEVEDLAYDHLQDKMFVIYYKGTKTAGFDIREFTNDTGLLNLTDYVDSTSNHITASDATIRILNGVAYINGYFTVNGTTTDHVLFKLPSYFDFKRISYSFAVTGNADFDLAEGMGKLTWANHAATEAGLWQTSWNVTSHSGDTSYWNLNAAIPMNGVGVNLPT